jgi:hypothetical protein
MKRGGPTGICYRLNRADNSVSAVPGALAGFLDADFQAWRDQEAWTAEKYRRFDRGERA